MSEPLSAETEWPQHEANYSPALFTIFDSREQLLVVLALEELLDADDHYRAEVSRVLCLRINSVIFCCVVSG